MEKLLELIEKSPTAYNAVATLKEEAEKAGATALSESETWTLQPGKMYFVTRNDSSFIAFSAPKKADRFHIFAAHTDSPSFKLKENPVMQVGTYSKLDVEPYGGMMFSTWLDRPLSIAGRLAVETKNGVKSVPVNVDEDLLVIPNVAIHQEPQANKGLTFNPQTDLIPLLGDGVTEEVFWEKVAASANVDASAILGHDLFLYNREKGRFTGLSKEYAISPRIDDLGCVFGGFSAFLSAKKKAKVCVFAAFDNEEIGSGTRQGAAGSFLKDTVKRIVKALYGEKDYREMIPESLMLSADNGHALHPNHPEKCDPQNRPVLNGGVLLKFAGNAHYSTDGMTAARFKKLAKDAGAKVQLFFNRSDMPGGRTLGNISTSQLAVPTCDIGLPELAMHSANETMGTKDYEDLVKITELFFK